MKYKTIIKFTTPVAILAPVLSAVSCYQAEEKQEDKVYDPSKNINQLKKDTVKTLSDFQSYALYTKDTGNGIELYKIDSVSNSDWDGYFPSDTTLKNNAKTKKISTWDDFSIKKSVMPKATTPKTPTTPTTTTPTTTPKATPKMVYDKKATLPLIERIIKSIEEAKIKIKNTLESTAYMAVAKKDENAKEFAINFKTKIIGTLDSLVLRNYGDSTKPKDLNKPDFYHSIKKDASSYFANFIQKIPQTNKGLSYAYMSSDYRADIKIHNGTKIFFDSITNMKELKNLKITDSRMFPSTYGHNEVKLNSYTKVIIERLLKNELPFLLEMHKVLGAVLNLTGIPSIHTRELDDKNYPKLIEIKDIKNITELNQYIAFEISL